MGITPMPNRIRVRPVEDGIFELNIHDPETQNRVTEELCDEMESALKQLSTEPALKVLVITGTKEVFCAGAAMDVLRKLSAGRSLVELTIPGQVLSFPVPVVAALEGHAVGGGLVLAICCDILVASESSRYGFNFTDMGFTPGMGTTALLPAMVGHSFAAEMLLTARFYKGRELAGRALFNHVVPSGEVLPVAWDLARRMAEKPRPVLEMLKGALAGPRRAALEQAFPAECAMHRACFSQPETWSIVNGNYLEKT
jgi:polyketide biosynthesis enoyl-CoA hydratase PksI